MTILSKLVHHLQHHHSLRTPHHRQSTRPAPILLAVLLFTRKSAPVDNHLQSIRLLLPLEVDHCRHHCRLRRVS